MPAPGTTKKGALLAMRLAVLAVRLAVLAVRLAVLAVRLAVLAVRLALLAVRLAVLAVRLGVLAARLAVLAVRLARSGRRPTRPQLTIRAAFAAGFDTALYHDLDAWWTLRAFADPPGALRAVLAGGAWRLLLQDDYPERPGGICAGVLAVRRGEWARGLLDEWWGAAEGGCCFGSMGGGSDQRCLHAVLIRRFSGRGGIADAKAPAEARSRAAGVWGGALGTDAGGLAAPPRCETPGGKTMPRWVPYDASLGKAVARGGGRTAPYGEAGFPAAVRFVEWDRAPKLHHALWVPGATRASLLYHSGGRFLDNYEAAIPLPAAAAGAANASRPAAGAVRAELALLERMRSAW
eukprot:gene18317-11585_t